MLGLCSCAVLLYLGYRDFFPPLSAEGKHGVMTYQEKSWKWPKIKWDSKNCSHLASGAVRCQIRPGQSGRCGCVRWLRPWWLSFDMEMAWWHDVICVRRQFWWENSKFCCWCSCGYTGYCLAWLSICNIQVLPLSSQLTTFFTKSWPRHDLNLLTGASTPLLTAVCHDLVRPTSNRSGPAQAVP